MPRHKDRNRIILHVSQVVDLQTNNKFAQAAEELERAIDAGLDHAAAYFDLGFLHAQAGQDERAIADLQNALKLPDFALGSHLLLGETYRNLGRVRDASLEYLEALKLADSQVVNPEQADDLRQLYEPLIEAHRHQVDPQVQERLCDNVNELLMRPDWRANLAHARKQLPNQDGNRPPMPLAEILTEARSGQVVESISKIYELGNQGKLRSAMEEAFYALQQAPTYLPLHAYIGELLLKEGLLQDATSKFMMVARTYSARGETARATEIYRKIIQLAPMDLNARSQLIAQLISNELVEEAIQEYIALGDVYYNLADLDMTRKTYTEALRLAQQAQVDRSWRVKLLHHMADIDLQSLDWRQAIRIFEQIRTLQPDDFKARSNLIELNFRLGQEQVALSELDNYLAYLTGTRKKDKAVSYLEELYKENPERIAVRSRLADSYAQSGRVQEAIEAYDAVGEALLEAGDQPGAIRAIEAILALNPPNKAEYQNLLNQIRGK